MTAGAHNQVKYLECYKIHLDPSIHLPEVQECHILHLHDQVILFTHLSSWKQKRETYKKEEA